MQRAAQQKIYEIMIHHKDLFSYGEDETKLELTAAFSELAEEFKGFENYITLLNKENWAFLFPRING